MNEVPLANQAQTMFFALIIMVVIFAIVGVIVIFGSKLWFLKLRLKNRKKSLKDKVFLKVQITEDNEYEVSVAEQVFSSLYGIKKITWIF